MMEFSKHKFASRRATNPVKITRVILTAGALLASAPVLAENDSAQVSLGKYLASAKNDARLRSRRIGGEFEYGTWTGLPWVRDLEVRVRNQAFDWVGQRYSLRIEPRGWGESRALGEY